MASPVFEKYKSLTTPKGIAVFPWLTKADTKFNEDGTYHTTLALDPKEPGVKEFLDRIKAITKEATEAVKASGVKTVKVAAPIVVEEDDDGNKTGMVRVKAKTQATRKGKDGAVAKVDLQIVDAKRNPHPRNIPVYGGSIIKINVSPVPRFVKGELYVTLYINAVQVIDLQTGGGVGGMFDEEEGYEAEGQSESAFADESEAEAVEEEAEEEEDMY